jgi:hypothetical protein
MSSTKRSRYSSAERRSWPRSCPISESCWVWGSLEDHFAFQLSGVCHKDGLALTFGVESAGVDGAPAGGPALRKGVAEAVGAGVEAGEGLGASSVE